MLSGYPKGGDIAFAVPEREVHSTRQLLMGCSFCSSTPPSRRTWTSQPWAAPLPATTPGLSQKWSTPVTLLVQHKEVLMGQRSVY